MIYSKGWSKGGREPWPSSSTLLQMSFLYLALLTATWVIYIRVSETGDGGLMNLVESSAIIDKNASVSSIENGKGLEPSQNSSQDIPKGEEKEDHHDDIPSFSEWAKKQIEEAEKNKGENLTAGLSGIKLRLKNYASPDCGAKVVGANPESGSPGAVLSPSRDEYILNPCIAKIWFIVELCEAIQPQRIEIANFELFSSSPKEFSVWLSDRHPSREWTLAAQITAKDEKTIQSFPLPHLPQFVKFIKLELHSHYGSEHYCPISLFRAYGTSEIEVLDAVDEVVPVPSADDEDEGKEEEEPPGPNNLFGTARDAVLRIVKKAAEVLVKGDPTNSTCKEGNSSSLQAHCTTPGVIITCDNCSDPFFYKVYNLICCHRHSLERMLLSNFVSYNLQSSGFCKDLKEVGFNISDPERHLNYTPPVSYLMTLFQPETLVALCNLMNISEKTLGIPSTTPPTPPTVLKEFITDEPLPSLDPIAHIEPTVETFTPSDSVSSPDIVPTKALAQETLDLSNSTVLVTPTSEETVNVNTSGSPIPSSTLEVDTPITKISEEVKPAQEEKEEEAKEEVNKTEPAVVELPITEGEEGIVDSLALDSLFPDLEEEQPHEDVNQKTQPPSSTSTSSSPSSSVPSSTQSPSSQIPVQKESVFVRLANRIKALEMNMSLSSQYLEELSRRYKKQVEELQRTLASVMEDRKLAAERESMQAAQLTLLTQRVEALTAAVGELIVHRDSWTHKATMIGQHGVIILVEVVVFVLVLWVCRWLGGGKEIGSMGEVHPPQAHLPQRRRSMDDIHDAHKPPPQKRRPSEEALKISGKTNKELLLEGAKRKTSRGEMRKRKKRRREVWESENQWQVPPEYVTTATWSRKQRLSTHTQTQSSSQETLSSITTPHVPLQTLNTDNKPPKKQGTIKKFVKKLF